jgi:hypothetical protein
MHAPGRAAGHGWTQSRIIRSIIAAGLFAIVTGGCGADLGGGGLVHFPANVQMERWESIASGSCKGWLTNNGNETARDVHVTFWYRTVQGDSALIVVPTSTTVTPYAHVAIYAPPQITRGELRFPGLGNITWSGGSSFIPGDPAPFVHNLGFACLVSPESARVSVQNDQGLAYHVVLTIETAAGVVQLPLRQNPIGRLWSDTRNCPRGYASGCEGWGNLEVPVTDSSGVKLLPRYVSLRWENYAGVPDSLLPPYGWPYTFGEYGVSACPP